MKEIVTSSFLRLSNPIFWIEATAMLGRQSALCSVQRVRRWGVLPAAVGIPHCRCRQFQTNHALWIGMFLSLVKHSIYENLTVGSHRLVFIQQTCG